MTKEKRVVFDGSMFPHPQMMYQMMGDESVKSLNK